MNFVQRIRDFFRMVFGAFLEGAEESVPLERRLAYDRVKRAETLRKQMKGAEDVRAPAEVMVQQLAEARIVSANLRQEAKAHLQAASSAAARGDDITRQQEEARASALAEELAMADQEVAALEQLVEESLADKRAAIDMVLEQSRELHLASKLKAPYVAAKHGLLGLARVAAKEGAEHNVRVNVICPGFVRTPSVEKQIPEQAKEFGITEEQVIKTIMLKDTVDGIFTTVDDVAQTALFLAAFPSAALTGQSITVSHGWHMQ